MIPTLILAAIVGATDPNITQDNIGDAICAPGYSASVRPPAAWSHAMRKAMGAHKGQILDHIVPLELGGSPTDPNNLQLQDAPAAKAKDRMENRLHRQVCAGRITLHDAQEQFRR